MLCHGSPICYPHMSSSVSSIPDPRESSSTVGINLSNSIVNRFLTAGLSWVLQRARIFPVLFLFSLLQGCFLTSTVDFPVFSLLRATSLVMIFAVSLFHSHCNSPIFSLISIFPFQ